MSRCSVVIESLGGNSCSACGLGEIRLNLQNNILVIVCNIGAD